MSSLQRRTEVTTALLTHLPQQFHQGLGLGTLLLTLWVDPRDTPVGGMRLSDRGHEAFRLAGVKGVEFPVKRSTANLLELSRELQNPYHLRTQLLEYIVTVYDEADIVQITLYGGIEEFLAGRRRTQSHWT